MVDIPVLLLVIYIPGGCYLSSEPVSTVTRSSNTSPANRTIKLSRATLNTEVSPDKKCHKHSHLYHNAPISHLTPKMETSLSSWRRKEGKWTMKSWEFSTPVPKSLLISLAQST